MENHFCLVRWRQHTPGSVVGDVMVPPYPLLGFVQCPDRNSEDSVHTHVPRVQPSIFKVRASHGIHLSMPRCDIWLTECLPADRRVYPTSRYPGISGQNDWRSELEDHLTLVPVIDPHHLLSLGPGTVARDDGVWPVFGREAQHSTHSPPLSEQSNFPG